MIRNQQSFDNGLPANYDGVFLWDFLGRAFDGANIMPMDIDAIIERRGQFLVFETKAPNVPVPPGQVITLEALCHTGNGRFRIIFCAKRPEQIDGWDVWYLGPKSKMLMKKHENGSAEDLVDYVHRWFRFASGLKLVSSGDAGVPI